MLLYKTRGFLSFIQTLANFVHAIGQRVICQQIQARQQAVQRGDALFRLFKLHTALLIIIFMIGQRTFQFNATAIQLANFRFWIGFKRHRQMAADKAAERLMQTLGFLYIKGERGETFRQPFTLGMQGFDTAFTRCTTKNRHLREAGITPLTLGGFHHHRIFQFINAEDAIIKRLRIPFDEIEIFRAIRQPFKLFGN